MEKKCLQGRTSQSTSPLGHDATKPTPHGTMASDHQHHHQVSNRAVSWQMRVLLHTPKSLTNAFAMLPTSPARTTPSAVRPNEFWVGPFYTPSSSNQRDSVCVWTHRSAALTRMLCRWPTAHLRTGEVHQQRFDSTPVSDGNSQMSWIIL